MNQRTVPLLPAVVPALALMPFLARNGMSRDEGATVYSARLPLRDLLEQARVQDAVLVPYYLLQHVWLLPSHDVAWARALSLVGYAAAVYFVTRAAQVWVGTALGVAAGVITAVNPWLIVQAFNARPYTLSAAAAAAAVLGLALLDSGDRRGDWVFAAGATAAVALHEFAAIGSLAALAALVIGQHIRWRLALRIAAAPVALMIVLAVASFGQRQQLSWMAPINRQSVVTTLLTPFGLIPEDGRLQAAVVVVLVLGVTALRRRVTAPTAASAAWLLAPPVMLVVGSMATPIYGARFVTASVPAVGLLVASVARVAAEWRPSRLVSILAVAVLVELGLAGALTVVRGLNPHWGYAAAAPTCAKGEVAAIPNHMAATAFGQYLPEQSRLWPMRTQPYLERFALDSSAAAMAAAPKVVTLCGHDGPYDATDVSRFRAALKDAGYTQRSRADFGGTFVITFRRA